MTIKFKTIINGIQNLLTKLDYDVINSRYKKSWFDKRIVQNKIIVDHLIAIIEKHKENGFPWSADELRYLKYEDLFEIAVATVKKTVTIVLGEGQDWNDGRDGKVAVARMNNYGKKYSAGITNCDTKEHITALVYEYKQSKFYYFDFPATLKEHTIPFELDGTPNRSNYMWQYECKTFEEMALK